MTSIKPKIYKLSTLSKTKLPLFVSNVKAGFPSPAEDYIEKQLDLNELLIKHPAATFFVKVEGDSMINAGIMPGSILVIDRAVPPANNKIVLAVINGEFTVKRFKRNGNIIILEPENPKYQEFPITPETDFQVWGVVIHVITPL